MTNKCGKENRPDQTRVSTYTMCFVVVVVVSSEQSSIELALALQRLKLDVSSSA